VHPATATLNPNTTTANPNHFARFILIASFFAIYANLKTA
jgi:hypothetical protein